jgi:Predicted transcriptional regulator
MRFTATETTETTLAHLVTAMDHQHPVTLTYLKEERDENGKRTGALVETVRTIETYDVTTTKAGNVIVKAMDRQTGESRTFRLDRIRAYTIHRTAYTVERLGHDSTRPAPLAPSLRRAEAVLDGRPYVPLSDAQRDAEHRVDLLAELLTTAA